MVEVVKTRAADDGDGDIMSIDHSVNEGKGWIQQRASKKIKTTEKKLN
jgi:hypothetical protein